VKQFLSFLLTLVGLLGFGQTSQSQGCKCPVCLGLPEPKKGIERREEGFDEKDSEDGKRE
jgi:hypothetical protein